MFSVRIVTTDHYMSPPLHGLDVKYAEQRGSEVTRVPVVRIFGATPAGQKTCMHVHGVFPYMYVPYDGTVPLERYLRQFAASLDKAINVAQGHGQATTQHVYKIVLVSGMAMYGYHDKEQQFLKIYLYKPSMIKKAADLLLGGAVLNKGFQPHEAHIPYTLQLFIDYNLYGMNMISVGAVKFRRGDKDDIDNPLIVRDVIYQGSQSSDEGLGSDPRTPVSFTALLNRSDTATPLRKTWDSENIPIELYLDASVERQSTCELEVDVVAADILNRLEVNANIGANPGLAVLWEDERQRRRDRGESEDITPPDSQERIDVERAESEIELENRLSEIVLQQLAYIESRSQSESEESQESEISATPASAVELHLSQTEDLMSSQETVILDEDEEEDRPVVNLDSIHRIVSSSQSFIEVKTKLEEGAADDKSLVDILASLAKESDTPPASQAAIETHVTELEEQDSILSQVPEPRNREVEEREAEEVLEMSQRIWDEDMTSPAQKDTNESPIQSEIEGYDLAGLDETWQESEAEMDSDDDNDVIPQLDGPGDEKPKSPRKRGPRRLGVTGPVSYMPRNPQAIPSRMYAPDYVTNQRYPGMPTNPQYGNSYYGNYGSGQDYKQWVPGMQQSAGISQNPAMLQNSQIQYSPRMQSPGIQQTQGILQSPGIQQSQSMQNPGMLQSPHMQQSPRLHHSPGSQQSPGIVQSPVGNFSPSATVSWDQGQEYGMQHSPPVVSVYGNDKSTQPPSNLNSSHNSQINQYQHYAVNTYGYQSVSDAGDVIQNDLTGYHHGHQVSPGYQSSPNEKEKRYQHTQLSPAYNQQSLFSGIQSRQTYSAAQDISQVAVAKSTSESTSRMYGIPRDDSQFSGAPKSVSISNSNAPQITHWQQRASVPLAPQRFQSVPSTGGKSEIQTSGVTSSTTNSSVSVGHYAGYKNSTAVQNSARVPNLSKIEVPESLMRNRDFTGCLANRTIDDFPQANVTKHNINVSLSSLSPGAQNNSSVISPELDNCQSGSNSAIKTGTATSAGLFNDHSQQGKLQEWRGPCQNISLSENLKDKFVNDKQLHELSYARKKLLYPECTGIGAVKNTQNSAQSRSQWKNVAQSDNVPVPNSVGGNVPGPYFGIVRKEKATESAKTLPKPLVPPVDGPVSRYYRQKLNAAMAVSSGEIKSPEAKGSKPSGTPLSSPASDISSPVSSFSGAVDTADKSSTALQKLLLQNTKLLTDAHQSSPARIKEPVPLEGSQSISKQKTSSLTSLLLEEDDEKSIVWQGKTGLQNEASYQGNAEQSRNNVSRHSFDGVCRMPVTANCNKNVTEVKRYNMGRHSVDNSACLNLSASLDNSQQDMFADRIQSMDDTRRELKLDSVTADEDSVSVFSDSMNKDFSGIQSGDHQSAEESVSESHISTVSSESFDSLKQDDLSSLSDLKTFVGSVEKGCEYGAVFQKPGAKESTDFKIFETTRTGASENVSASSLIHDRTVKATEVGNNQVPQNQLLSNILPTDSVMLPKPKRKYTRKNPNLPPIKRSVSLPGIPGLKRKRGRPRKDSVPVQLPSSSFQSNHNQSFSAQQFQQEFQTQQFQQQNYTRDDFSQSAFFPQASYLGQVSYQEPQFYPQQDISNQSLQNHSSFLGENQQNFHTQSMQNHPSLLGKHQQDIQSQSVQPAFIEEEQQNIQNRSVHNQSSFLEESQENIQIQSQSSFLGELMDENDYSFQQNLGLCSNPFTAEKDSFGTPLEMVESVNALKETFNYNEMRNRASQEMQAFHKEQEMLSKTIFESNLKSWRSATQKESQVSLTKTGLSAKSVNESKLTSLSHSSPSYTFQFKVPTPVYKRLKLRFRSEMKETFDKLEMVRMHPKDARKYSLLKIGSEVVKLHKLTKNKIERIQEDLLSGKDVLGIPPELRQVEKASKDLDDSSENELPKEVINSLQENQKTFTQMYSYGNNIHIQRKQKKTSDSLFKNRNIANIPHLKKYRAGFPYFGKGNVGKKITTKQAHPVLSPELEEDNDVVLKDVSLIDASEGTLTPIKSRTPIAGRSPAHSGGHVLESENKEYLENKLKEFEGDLDISSQANEPQIFENESNLFDDEKQVDEYDGATDTDQNQVTSLSKQEPFTKKDLLENNSDTENYVETYESEIPETEQECVSFADMDIDKTEEVVKSDEIAKTQNVVNNINGAVNVMENTNIYKRKELINKIKQEISMKEELLEKVKERLIEALPDKRINPEVYEMVHKSKSRSRSDSIETYSSSESSSRRDSLSNSIDMGRAKRLSSVDSFISNKFKNEKRKRSSSSSSSRNINTSRLSKDDRESKHKRRANHSKRKKQRRYLNYSDSDSDGIPGVDYIVVGRFKGHKEMRVILHKVDVDESDSVNAQEMMLAQSKKERIKQGNKIDTGKEDEIPCMINPYNNEHRSPVSDVTLKSNPFSGFSAEFEKFLAQGRSENKNRTNGTQIMSGQPMNNNKPSSEDCSWKGDAGSHGNSSVENSDGSGNEHGESSSSDMCLSTNHTILHENISAFKPSDEINIFLGELSNENSKIDEVSKQKLCLSVVSNKHSPKKKKRNTIHDRMSRAFVGKRRKRQSRKPTKLINSLSALHDATMEKLTEDLQQSPLRDSRTGPIKLKINLKCLRRSSNFELYCDDVDSDYDAPYCDTMYKLAWYSPPESETGDISPPQPLSPEQISDIENVDQNVKKIPYCHSPVRSAYTLLRSDKQSIKDEKLNLLDIKRVVNSANSPLMEQKQGLKEERLTLADIQKMNSANLPEMESERNLKENRLTLRDLQRTANSGNHSEMQGDKCLREEKLTLADIQKTVKNTNSLEMEKEKLKLTLTRNVINEVNVAMSRKESNRQWEDDKLVKSTHLDIEMDESVNMKNEMSKKTTPTIHIIAITDKSEVVQSDDINSHHEKNVGGIAENISKENELNAEVSNENRSFDNILNANDSASIPPLTIPDEQTYLVSDDENESASNKSNEENVSPPDLGPPNIPRFSPRLYQAGNNRMEPPQLTVGNETLYVNTDNEICQVVTKPKDLSKNSKLNDKLMNDSFNTPPNLVPCKSPGFNSYESKSPRQLFLSPDKDSGCLKRKPGQSPAQCSSNGSINVIHSEEFSDISDDENDKEDFSSQHKQPCDEGFSMPPALSRIRNNIVSYLQNSASSLNQDKVDKKTKLREIADFEKGNFENNRLVSSDSYERFDPDREKMKSSIKEFESKHEAVNLSKDSSSLEIVIGKNELKRRHSIPMFKTSNIVAPPGGIGIFDTTAQNFCQNNLSFGSDMPNFDSCKFSRLRHKKFVGTGCPKYTSVDCASLNGFRSNTEFPGKWESNQNTRTDFIQRPTTFDRTSVALNGYERQGLHSQHGLPQMFFDKCLSSSEKNNLDLQTGVGNIFNRFDTNISKFHGSQPNVTQTEFHKTTYNICKNRRISESILKSVEKNQSALEKDHLDSRLFDNLCKGNLQNPSGGTLTQLGTGGNQNIRHKNLKQSGDDSMSRSDSNNEQTMSGHSSGREGGDMAGNGDHPETDKHGSVQMLAGCQVITPLTVPPTRECVYESANQFGLPSVQAKEAFYGNPKDAPERPREGGGQLLKVSTNMVKTLSEFETSGKFEGLLSWRNLLCTKENLFASQREDNSSLCDRLEREPALKYALTGDKSVVVTPCLLPPSKSIVREWFKGRQLYKAWKKQTVIPDIKTESGDTNSEPSRTPDSDNAEGSRLSDVRLNLFTGKREVAHVHSDLTEPPVLVREEPHDHDIEDVNVLRESKAARSKQEEEDIDIRMSPLEKQPRLDDSSQLHSTPVTRRSSSDLFDSYCTPIPSGGITPGLEGDGRVMSASEGSVTPTLDQKEENRSGQHFVTPKRIRPPLRRLSISTESALRRAIITSQMKQQFCTPALQKELSQIDGPTPKNSFGFKVSQQNFQDAKALHENQYLTVLSLEIHAETRGDLRPDPEFDSIQGIFYSIFNDVPPEWGPRHVTGAIIVDAESASQTHTSSAKITEKDRRLHGESVPGTSKSTDPGLSAAQKEKLTLLQKSGISDLEVVYTKDEAELIKTFIEFIKKWDPDILVGFEVQLLSWGYLLQRASTLNTNLVVAISRVPTAKTSSHMSAQKDEYAADHGSEIHIAGRIVLNLWRLLRHEVSLNVYTYENVAFHVLHRRVPLFSFRTLTSWYKHRTHLHRWKVICHYVCRVKGNLELMDQLDIIGRTSEFARVFGIEFYHVLSRGSQYRVESMMLRVAKPMNYIAVSPSVHQRARMKAPECIPLTLEPESRFYTDPVVVLDFQSLYPSIMIGYNYCFSTCMGRVDWLSKAHEGPIEFGCTSLNLPPSVLKKLQDDLTYSPNGAAFVKQSVKRGVLPIMVEEILKTRLMVKKAMKDYKGDKTLSRMLDARQLGLKLIANVTYGYTGASFSGRMPCIEVGDSVVRKARETLERSIKLVEETPKWGAKVVYGDTDSMFLLLKGKSKDEAFKIGQEIADTVTKMFPKPVKLKFEKVYLPCVLQTKKRYVGFMYETPDQKEPVFDAKGIETVRRDSCQAVSKILERSIKILFQSKDVSQVKSYVQHQCQKLMEGTVSLQDCIFAKEFRGISGYKPGACVPALEITKKLIRQDRRAEPRVGERVPYVIVYGSPGLPLIQLVRQPMELLQDGSLRLNATYYITKQILPPLSRFLSLLGVDVFSWYHEMPHISARAIVQTASPRKGTISQYFATSNCPICDEQTKQSICQRCMKEPQMVCVVLNDKISHWERVQDHLNKVCSVCIGCSDSTTVKSCISLDCPVLFRQSRAQRDSSRADTIREILAKVFN